MTIRVKWEDPDEVLPPENPRDHWIIEGLLTLDDRNLDGATVRNGIGFNKLDTEPGEIHAATARSTGGLTRDGWRWARRALPKYRRQIGDAPA